MLKTRVLTALLLVFIFAAVLASGSLYGLALLLSAAIYLAVSEWLALTLCWHGLKQRLAATSGVLLFIAVITWFPPNPVLDQTVAWIVSLFWLSIAFNLRASPQRFWVLQHKPLAAFFGILLLISCGWMWVRLVESNATYMLVLLMVTVAIADSGAYFFGKRFGRHKLAPLVSPGKTVEGLLGGVALVIALALILAFSQGLTAKSAFYLLLTCVLAALFSVVGDLFESAAKRAAGVKDSGKVLPGHGGVLDRVDGLLAATPVFMLMQAHFPVLL